MEQGRFSLTPRTQRRSQNFHSDAAKIGIISETSKLLKQKFVFLLFFSYLSAIRHFLYASTTSRIDIIYICIVRCSGG